MVVAILHLVQNVEMSADFSLANDQIMRPGQLILAQQATAPSQTVT